MSVELQFHREECEQLRLMPARVVRLVAGWFVIWMAVWPLTALAFGKPVHWIGTLVMAIWMACMMPAWLAWRERKAWERDRKLKSLESLESERLGVVQSALTSGAKKSN